MKSVSRFPSPRRSAAPAAFTLVELLTVIAIIAILAAIIYPAMSSAQKKAQQSTSISNLHSWYTGFTNYMGDNNGDMPTPGNGAANPGDNQSWINALPKGLGIATYANFIGDDSIRPGYGKKSVWVNPAVPQADTAGGLFTFFYGYNDKLVVTTTTANGGILTEPMKFNRLDNAHMTILMGEKADANPSLNFSNARAYFSSTDSKTDPNGLCDLLFCDGHTESVKRSVFSDTKTLDGNAFTNHLATISWLPFQE